MPLTDKGNKIMGHMKEEYGSKEGEKVFYASKNAGKISGVDSDKPCPIRGYLDAVAKGDSDEISRSRDLLGK